MFEDDEAEIENMALEIPAFTVDTFLTCAGCKIEVKFDLDVASEIQKEAVSGIGFEVRDAIRKQLEHMVKTGTVRKEWHKK